MVKKSLQYPTVFFDWGGTVMYDDLSLTTPMVEWEEVRVVEGIGQLLQYLHESGRKIILATSASISDEAQIRGALARADLDRYFSQIYCFKNTGLSKGKAFYRHILRELNIPASDALMVGDSYEKDVQAANLAGMFGVWFNWVSDEIYNGKLNITVHSMTELFEFFKARDAAVKEK